MQRVLLSLALGAAVAWGAAPAFAAFPGSNGKIVFESSRSGDPEVWSMNYDGTRQQQLTRATGWDRDAAISADGRLIAFTTQRTGSDDIWLMAVDGTGQHPLTTGPASDEDPAWSPDATRVVFSSDRLGGRDLFVADVATGVITRLTSDPGADEQPAWSPDGSTIAFASNRSGHYDIWSVPADGSAPERQLTSDVTADLSPSWSPDGKRIAFETPRSGLESWRIDVVSPAGGDDKPLLPSAPVPARDPAWSPDGQRVAFASGDTLGDAPVDGTPGETLTSGSESGHDADWGPIPPPEAPPEPAETAAIAPAGGSSSVMVRGAGDFTPLVAPVEVKVGATVDATKGAVTLVTTAAGGAAQEVKLSSGRFGVTQTPKAAVTLLDLRGGSFRRCGPGRASAARKPLTPGSVVRKLFGRGHGVYRTNGKYLNLTVHGTTWVVKDLCKGTTARILHGQGVVFDRLKRRKVVLRAGHSYTVRPR